MISIIIPCYNECSNINELLLHIEKVLANEAYEIIFVDDGSSDNSLNILKSISYNNSKIKYISLSRNFGHQNALKAGLDHSIGDCAITLDADLQHPPEIIPQMLMKWKKGFDIVYTIRCDIAKGSFFKKITSRIFYKIINYLSDVHIDCGAADFRLLDRKVIDILKNNFNEYTLFYRGIINWIGFNKTSIDYFSNQRFSGQTKYTLIKMLNFAISGITSFSIRPLRIAMILGFLFSLLSLLYAAYAAYAHFFINKTITGWSSVIICILLIGGIQMILIGIIGEYLGKMFFEIKKRPHYLIKEMNIQAK